MRHQTACRLPHNSAARGRAAGFSLPELIVALGVIMLLLGMLVPSVSRAWRQAEAVKCQSQLRQLGLALAVYANENRGVVYPYRGEPPGAPTWAEILFDEPTPPVLVCPSGADIDWRSYQINGWIRYGPIRIDGGNAAGLPASRIVLAGESRPGALHDYSWVDSATGWTTWDPARHGPGLMSNYLWLDGHVDNIAPPPAVPPDYDPWYVDR